MTKTKKNSKTGLLILLLVVPVFFIALLQFFSEPNFKIKPPYYPNGINGEDDKVHTIPDFKLQNQANETITLNDIKGKVVIADFFFSTCQTICPVMSSQMTRVQEAFKTNDEVVLLSHSIDPETDSVQIMAAYAKKYQAIPGKWHLLTGPKEELYRMAHQGYALSAVEDNTDPQGFIHSDKMVLVDKLGRIRGYYSGVDPLKVDTLILETKILLSE
jgi:protein SCO1/2